MKRIHSFRSFRNLLLFLMLCAVLLLASSCSSSGGNKTATSETVPMVLNTNEYILYQNIFYNNYAQNYTGKRVEKTGIITSLTDAFFGVTRYYVWGYNDNTKCCDWQWEFSPANSDQLPANGSLVKVSGTFSSSDQALDAYWIRNAEVETITAYTGPTAEIDMAAMSDTLERVQIINIISYPELFENKTYSAFGSIAALGILEDPYYGNSSWSIPFSSESPAPSVGTESLLRGTIASGTLANAAFSAWQ